MVLKKNVATVSKTDKVTARSAGTTTITAIIGGKKYTCKVTVKNQDDKVVTATVTNLFHFNEFDDYLSTIKISKTTVNDLTLFGLFIYNIGYQQFSGIQVLDMKFSVSIIDKNTMKEFENIDLLDMKH